MKIRNGMSQIVKNHCFDPDPERGSLGPNLIVFRSFPQICAKFFHGASDRDKCLSEYSRAAVVVAVGNNESL